MTATASKTCDVFISHAVSDSHLASEIAEGFESAGLETFHTGTVKPGSDISDAIWHALAESRALIVVISPDAPPDATGFVEIGAASAWNKPIFLVINGPSSTKLPAALNAYPVYPISRLEDVIREVRAGFEPLSDQEYDALTETYREVDTSADQLSQSPATLHNLTTKFNRRVHRQYSGERLLSELFRMRKQGQLPRLRNGN